MDSLYNRPDAQVLDKALEGLLPLGSEGDIAHAVFQHLWRLKGQHGGNFKLEPVKEWLAQAVQRIEEIKRAISEAEDDNKPPYPGL